MRTTRPKTGRSKRTTSSRNASCEPASAARTSSGSERPFIRLRPSGVRAWLSTYGAPGRGFGAAGLGYAPVDPHLRTLPERRNDPMRTCRRTLPILLLASAAALSSPAPGRAGTLAGVTLPDSVQAGSESLVLNGMGLRKKLFIKVYVAGLYLRH